MAAGGRLVRPSGETLNPGITVVIPVWDEYVRFLVETLGSLERQRPRPQIVLVDNASDTAVAKNGYTVIRSPARLSRGAARNLGLSVVETELVMFWDADDHLCDGALADMVDALGGDVRVVGCQIVEQGSRRPHRWPRPSTLRRSRHVRLFALLELIWPSFPVTGSLMRTAEVRELGGYSDTSQSESWPLAAALAARGRIRLLARPGIEYRVDDGAEGRPSAMLKEGARARRVVRSDEAADPLVRLLAPLTGFGSALVAYVLRPLRARLMAR